MNKVLVKYFLLLTVVIMIADNVYLTPKKTDLTDESNMVFNIFSSAKLEKGFFVRPIDFKISKKGEIFFIDSKMRRVLKYSKKGRFIKYISQRGQGPGEYIAPSKLFIGNSKLYIYDMISRKIHVYKLSGKYINTINFGKSIDFQSDFYVDKKGKIYCITREFEKKELLEVLGKSTNPENNFTNIKILKRTVIKTGPVIGGIETLYSPMVFMRIGLGGFYFGNNLEREIYFYNVKTGKIRKVINLNYVKEKINSKERRYLRKKYGNEVLKKLSIYRPFYKDFLIDNKNNVYVIKMPDVLLDYDKRKERIDVFNNKGSFLRSFSLFKNTIPIYIYSSYMFVLKEKDDEFYISKLLM